jgi:hypothetical protein
MSSKKGNLKNLSGNQPSASKRQRYPASGPQVSFSNHLQSNNENWSFIRDLSENNLKNPDLIRSVIARIGRDSTGKSVYLYDNDRWKSSGNLPALPPRGFHSVKRKSTKGRLKSDSRAMKLVHAASFNPDSLPPELLSYKESIISNQKIAKHSLKQIYPDIFKKYFSDENNRNNENNGANPHSKGGYLSKKKRINKYKSKSIKKRSS